MMDDKDFALRSDERGADGEGLSLTVSDERACAGATSLDETVAHSIMPAPTAASERAEATAIVERTETGPALQARGLKVKAALRARLGEEVFSSWFASLEFQCFDGQLLKVTVPVKFLKN